MITMRYGNLEIRNINRLANFTRTICLIYLAVILVSSCGFYRIGIGYIYHQLCGCNIILFLLSKTDTFRSSRITSAAALAAIDYISTLEVSCLLH